MVNTSYKSKQDTYTPKLSGVRYWKELTKRLSQPEQVFRFLVSYTGAKKTRERVLVFGRGKAQATEQLLLPEASFEVQWYQPTDKDFNPAGGKVVVDE